MFCKPNEPNMSPVYRSVTILLFVPNRAENHSLAASSSGVTDRVSEP